MSALGLLLLLLVVVITTRPLLVLADRDLHVGESAKRGEYFAVEKKDVYLTKVTLAVHTVTGMLECAGL